MCIALLTGAPAGGQVVTDCSERTSAANIREPWEGSVRTYLEGTVRVVMVRPSDPKIQPDCKMISLGIGLSDEPAIGVTGLDFDTMSSEYLGSGSQLLEFYTGWFDMTDGGDLLLSGTVGPKEIKVELAP